jgi:hypothetical protein
MFFLTKNGLINLGLMSKKQLNKKRQPLREHSSMCQVGLEAAFQVPMPGDSGSRPDVGSISNYCLTQEIFTTSPADCCPLITLKQCFGQ